MARTRFCQRCKVEIPAERIEALPETRLGIRCSKEVGGEFNVTVTPESIGKSGSLKKNYGGITITKTRRPVRPRED